MESHAPLRIIGIVGRVAGLLTVWGLASGLILAAVSVALAAEGVGYTKVTGPCRLEFPADHGAHPGFRTEWWYYTGNLESHEGRPFGFQLTIFRRQISPPEARKMWPDPSSGWRTQNIYFGHAALSDISHGRHYSAEEIARGAMNLAGVGQTSETTTVFLKRWEIRIGSVGQRISAVSDDFQFDLELNPVKPLVLHGDLGYSRKGDSGDRASCYYSYTRLKTEGRLKIGEKVYVVSGTAWMDHEFSTAALQADIVGWDWFSLQLDGNREVMVYILRQSDGSPHPASSGTVVRDSGETRHLSMADFQVDVLAHWRSPHSNGVYPARWQLIIPTEEMILDIVPKLADQEMRTTGSTDITYWEGSVSVSGNYKGGRLGGKGYVEMTGYSEKFKHLE